jgi:uncharacterized membrane protein YedE/YeeE
MINTRKAYRMLVVVLFFAFVSLISRSIIYLILSVAIATMIMFLLSSAKKTRNQQGLKNNQTVGKKDQNIRLHKFFIGTTVIGALILGYGSLFFAETTFFHQLVTVPNQLYVAIVIIFAGFSIVLISLYFIIREMLGVNVKNNKGTQSKQSIYCGNCGTKNNPDHTYCSSCGTEISK